MKKMEQQVRIVALAAAAGLAAPALAQDSVSKVAAFGSDAVSPWDTSEQCDTYIVDLAPLTTSWGTSFGIAPLVKSSRASAAFANNLISAQGASATLRTGVPFASATYSLWNGPGFGVNNNPEVNDPGSPVNPTGTANQFAATFADFGTTGAGASFNGVWTALVNVKPDNTGRLYVKRVNAVLNGATSSQNTAQFGIGGVDAAGNTSVRADDFGVTGPNPLVGNNYFRVEAAARACNALNVFDNAGGSDAPATDWLLVRSGTTHNTPNALPAELAGRPLLIGSNFSDQYVREAVAGSLTSDSSHLAGSATQRGGVHFSRAVNFAGTVGTGAILGKSPGSSPTNRVITWGMLANGNVSGTRVFDLPASITDNSDGHSVVGTNYEFGNYDSQVFSRGGNGQAAVGRDAAGRMLVAGMIRDITFGGANNPINAIAVARFDPGSGTTAWTLAAYNNFPNGKAILDGPGGTPIGQLVELNQVTGGSPLGPSMSSPAIDCAGNIWFLSAVEIFDPLGGPSDFDSAIIRAVYDPATFSYELELVAEVGQVFDGQNSGLPWQLRFMGIADSNSVSSGSMFSNNLVQNCCNNADPADLDPADPRSLGGLVVNAEITYDTIPGDGDGDGFIFDEDEGDQSYQVLLFLGCVEAEEECYGDYDGNGTINTLDFIAFLNDFNDGVVGRDDCDGNGTINTLDFICFLNAFNAGCP